MIIHYLKYFGLCNFNPFPSGSIFARPENKPVRLIQIARPLPLAISRQFMEPTRQLAQHLKI